MMHTGTKPVRILHDLVGALAMIATFVLPLNRPAFAEQKDWFQLAHFYHSKAPRDAYTDLSRPGAPTRNRRILETDPAKITARSNAVRRYALEEGMINASMINWVHWTRDWENGLQRSAKNMPTAQQLTDTDSGLIVQALLSYHVGMVRSQGKQQYRKRVDAWVDQTLDRMRALGGNRVWWLFHGGQVLVARWPNEGFASKAEAYRWFERYIRSGEYGVDIERHKLNFPSPDSEAGKALAEEREVMKDTAPYVYIKRRGLNRENCNLMSFVKHAGLQAHYCFEWGTRFVLVNDKSDFNIQILTAFARGAANQYSGFWGYCDELAEIYRSEDGGSMWSYPCYNKEGERTGGISPTNMRNRNAVAYFHGAHILVQQQACLDFFMYDWDDGTVSLTPHGEMGRQFSDFVFKRHPDRGTTHVPVAVMLEHDHGWDPFARPRIGALDVVWGCIPFTAGDHMVDNFFRAAFPDFEKNYKGSAGRGPWKTMKDVDQAIRSGFDTRPYESKCLTHSRWGDSFDVILEDCPPEALNDYPVVMLLGDIELKGRLLERLKAYVEGGGVLVANVAQIREEADAAELFGVELTGTQKGSTFSSCRQCASKRITEGLYSYRRVAVRDAEVLAVNESRVTGYGDPLITSRRVGKGEAILGVAQHLQTHDRAKLLEVGLHLVTHLTERFALAEVAGPPIEYIVNRTDQGILVVLVNHDGAPWRGTITAHGLGAEDVHVAEWWEDRAVRHRVEAGDATFEASVPGYGLRVYAVATDRDRPR